MELGDGLAILCMPVRPNRKSWKTKKRIEKVPAPSPPLACSLPISFDPRWVEWEQGRAGSRHFVRHTETNVLKTSHHHHYHHHHYYHHHRYCHHRHYHHRRTSLPTENANLLNNMQDSIANQIRNRKSILKSHENRTINQLPHFPRFAMYHYSRTRGDVCGFFHGHYLWQFVSFNGSVWDGRWKRTLVYSVE